MFDNLLRCIFCGELTSDWWHADPNKGECRCHACYGKGIAETEVEKSKVSGFRFNPKKNADYFKPEFSQGIKKTTSNLDSFHVVRFAPQASLIEFSPRLVKTKIFPSSRIRGAVTGFSIRSRSRLNKKIATIKKHHIPLFVTLTYGENYPNDFPTYKEDLHNFFMALKYHFPEFGCIWKLEFQDRGAPHFHLLLWGVPIEDRDQLVDIWYKIAGNDDLKVKNFHLGLYENQHCVQQIRSWGGVVSYAGKYFSKLDNDTTRGGRVWGSRGKVPYSALIEFRVNLDQALLFRSALALARNYEFQRLGFWTNDYSVEWLLLLNNILEYSNAPACPEDFPNWELDNPPEFDDEDIQFS